MKLQHVLLAAAVVLSAASPAAARSSKRGVSESSFSMASQLEVLEPAVGWYYNWAGTPPKGYQDQVIGYEGMEFVPMCWNANYNADAIREYCRSHPSTKYLLGFNEPNFTAQANMTPAEAAEAWPAVKALADELGLELVAPALNYSPNPPYTDPTRWMDEFVALVGPDAFDYTAIHNYGGLGVMKTLAGAFHEKYGKPVWVTEFCYWPGEGQNTYVSPESQISSMTETVQWLEQTPWIFRYAWFKAMGAYDSSKGPNYGLIRHEGSIDNPWELTPQGQVYVGLGTFDTDVWNPVGAALPATDYTDSQHIAVAPACAGHDGLMISSFNAGAWTQWQFDIPEAGEYIVTLTVSGVGEPDRFDPQLRWNIVEGETVTPLGETFRPALPNNDTEARPVAETVTLPAGHVVLRLTDQAPYSPSGIHILSVRVDDAAGIHDAPLAGAGERPVDVFTLQGIRVRAGVSSADPLAGLPSGIYIVEGRRLRK